MRLDRELKDNKEWGGGENLGDNCDHKISANADVSAFMPV